MTEEFEALMDRRWIRKSEDRDLYFRIRDQLPEIRKFATEKMGCQIIETPSLVKMEKIPAQPESFMGIREFTAPEDYAYLCVLLMFLEDREAGEQFILSQVTEYFAGNMPGGAPDWTIYTNRRRLIRVLRYAEAQGMLIVTDGNEDSFMEGREAEVLYENTGASRFFMRSFSTDIHEYTSPKDFEGSRWLDVNEDRGIARRQRVYNRLLFLPGMYKADGSEEDFEYLKNKGRFMTEELEKLFDCRIHIHKGSAYFLEGDDCRMGETLPEGNVMSDMILLICAEIRKQVESGAFPVGADEMILVDRTVFEALLRDVRDRYGSHFTKTYREMPEGEWIRTVTAEMELWTLVREIPESHMVRIAPAAGKLEGRYPESGEALPETGKKRRRKRGV